MRNRKQMLADFYLELLKIPHDSSFRVVNQKLYAATRDALAYELCEHSENVQNVFLKEWLWRILDDYE